MGLPKRAANERDLLRNTDFGICLNICFCVSFKFGLVGATTVKRSLTINCTDFDSYFIEKISHVVYFKIANRRIHRQGRKMGVC